MGLTIKNWQSKHKTWLNCLAAGLFLAVLPAGAQDNPGSPTPALPTPAGNPLEGLFTPQPQYQDPQTIMNMDPSQPPNTTNQLQGLFTPQPQYPTPQTIMNRNEEQPPGESNPLKGLYTAQPQYPDPQTIMNMDPVPKNYVAPTPEAAPAPAVPAPTGQPTQPAPAPSKEQVKASAKKAIKEKAKSKLDKAKKKAAKPPEPPVPTVQLNPLTDAIFYMQSDQNNKALATLDSYLTVSPNDAQAHYLKAVTFVAMRRYADASGEYQKTIVLAPDSKVAGLARDGLKKLGN